MLLWRSLTLQRLQLQLASLPPCKAAERVDCGQGPAAGATTHHSSPPAQPTPASTNAVSAKIVPLVAAAPGEST